MLDYEGGSLHNNNHHNLIGVVPHLLIICSRRVHIHAPSCHLVQHLCALSNICGLWLVVIERESIVLLLLIDLKNHCGYQNRRWSA